MRHLLATAAAMAMMTLGACGSHDEPPVMVNQVTLANSVSHEMTDADPTLPTRLSLTGQQFADSVAASDAFEIASSQLAQQRAAAPAVRDFAARMIQAHTQSQAKIAQAASRATPALTPHAALSPAQAGKLAALRKVDEAAFDGRYVRLQVEAHEAALAALHDYAAHGEVGTLRQAAQELAPEVQGHLTMAQNLEK